MGIVAVLILLVGDLEAVFGVADGRCQQLAPRQLAELAMGLPQAHHRAWHACSTDTHQAQVLDHFAFVIQVHVARGRLGRHFTVVKEVGLAVHEQRHEAPTANVAGFGVSHCQRECGGYRGIDRVAAFFQDIGGYLGAILIRRGDSPALQGNGVHR